MLQTIRKLQLAIGSFSLNSCLHYTSFCQVLCIQKQLPRGITAGPGSFAWLGKQQGLHLGAKRLHGVTVLRGMGLQHPGQRDNTKAELLKALQQAWQGWLQAVCEVQHMWQLLPTESWSWVFSECETITPQWTQTAGTALGSPDIHGRGNLQSRHSVPMKSGAATSHSSVRPHRRMPQASPKTGVCQKGQKASKEVNGTSVAAGGARPSLSSET